MKQRGFITMATGDIRYYKMALTLLRSYRATTKDPMPFGIICDRENRYTREFDDVFLITDPTFTYMDKIRLLKIDTYREALFVDSDCIAYGDLNQYWNYYKGCTDFSCFGFAHPCDSGKGYFWPDTIVTTLSGLHIFLTSMVYVITFAEVLCVMLCLRHVWRFGIIIQSIDLGILNNLQTSRF